MFKHLLKNKKAQNMAEYALLIALVVAGIVAMQQYAQRALQARVRDAAVYMASSNDVNQIGSSVQYEPYYQQTNFAVVKNSVEKKVLDEGLFAQQSGNARSKLGNQTTTYNTAATAGTGAMPAGL